MPFVDVGTTMRRKMTPARAVRIWEARRGICILCDQPIDGPRCEWVIEHPRALGLGGSDDDKHLGPAHRACADKKTYGPNGDLALIAKAKRVKAKHIGARNKGPNRLRGAGFRKAEKTRWRSSAELERMGISDGQP